MVAGLGIVVWMCLDLHEIDLVALLFLPFQATEQLPIDFHPQSMLSKHVIYS